MSETKLLPCPFCGGEAELVGDNYHWVLCKGCKGGSHAFKTVEEAINAWNTRKPVERILEKLEEDYVDSRDCLDTEKDFYLGMCQGLQYAINQVREEVQHD